MPASKADQVEKARRIKVVVESLLKGYSVQDVVLTLQEQYGIGQTQAYEYAKEATSVIYRKIEGTLDEKINKHYQRLEYLYKECVTNGDRRTARMVLKDIAELIGLDAPKRTDITSGGEKVTAVFVDVLGVSEDQPKDAHSNKS